MNRILCFGSLNRDMVFEVPHIVQPGETIAAGSVTCFCGGKGFNQAVALKRAGSRVNFAGKLGADGEMLRQALSQEEIDLKGLMTDAEGSGSAYIQKTCTGQNSIILFGGANRKITCEEIDSVLSEYEEGDILVAQNEISQMKYLLEQACKKGMRIALNPSPMEDWITGLDMSMLTWLIMNEVETEQLTGEKDLSVGLKKLTERWPELEIIMTLGEEGSVYAKGDFRHRSPAFSVKTVDTTAAGDTFLGYLISGLTGGLGIEKAMERGAAAAALAVTRNGALPSIPNSCEVDRFLTDPAAKGL